MGNFFYF